jgi:hypothetical protein
MSHKPDKTKLPAVLQSLPWIERTDADEWFDGMELLVAVPASPKLGWHARKEMEPTWRVRWLSC